MLFIFFKISSINTFLKDINIDFGRAIIIEGNIITNVEDYFRPLDSDFVSGIVIALIFLLITSIYIHYYIFINNIKFKLSIILLVIFHFLIGYIDDILYNHFNEFLKDYLIYGAVLMINHIVIYLHNRNIIIAPPIVLNYIQNNQNQQFIIPYIKLIKINSVGISFATYIICYSISYIHQCIVILILVLMISYDIKIIILLIKDIRQPLARRIIQI